MSYLEARELSDLTGIPVLQLATLNPRRLILHELLVRVTADLSVADDQAYEVLGINLRRMVATIEQQYIAPHLPVIERTLNAKLASAESFIDQQLQATLFETSTHAYKLSVEQSPDNTAPHVFSKLFGYLFTSKSQKKHRRYIALNESERSGRCLHLHAIDVWQNALESHSENSMKRSCLLILMDVVNAIVRHRGRLLGDQRLLRKLVVNRLRMGWGADVLAQLITEPLNEAIQQQAYRRLPIQQAPVIMNVKGASASGKSTIRPQQRVLSQRLDIAWEDFALISPDYWRKSLLDYASLGSELPTIKHLIC